MNKSQLEHLLVSAAKIGDDNEIIVIGSQSVLGQFPEAGKNPVLSYSMEADIYLKNKLDNTILVEGSIGEGHYFIRPSVITLKKSAQIPRYCPKAGKTGCFQFV